jgi:nucleotide-binding universal stress UspA family protein
MTGSALAKLNSVVLAIDGSDHAQAAVKFIQNLHLSDTCSISLISVLIPRNAQYHAALETILEQTSEEFRSKQILVDKHLLTGYPAEQIIKFAKENDPNLLVLGAKGLRGTLRILLGGVVQQVVNYVSCPVLIVRSPHVSANRVLLATDGSEHSEFVLEHLDICPLPKEAQVTVMHVLPPEMTSEMLIRSWPYGIDTLPHAISTDIDETLLEKAKEEQDSGQALLKRTIRELTDLNINADSMLARGDAATEILNYADDNGIDLIIAGSRGLSQVQSLFLGSVSSKLIHYANCSVLIVK